jgi:hypothetical protein|tara:strand:- start:539 stop:925 length:387 start_codon:yes stop_codon:yes gene_type:complete
MRVAVNQLAELRHCLGNRARREARAGAEFRDMAFDFVVEDVVDGFSQRFEDHPLSRHLIVEGHKILLHQWYRSPVSALGIGICATMRLDTARPDGENGLLFTPSMEHLFERGFIFFAEAGGHPPSHVA